jgi:glycosyltransferase involved in cell wall biosynthesis
MAPVVSLVVPVRNGEKYLEETLKSLLAQDFDDFELIITDNASSDRTPAIAQAFSAQDPRVRYVRNNRDVGAAANFNRGFELSQGEFFKWCAHDDLLSTDFLSRCVEALRQNPGAALAHGRQQLIDSAGNPMPGITGDLTDIDDVADPARRFRMVFATQGFDTAMFGLFRRACLARTSLHRPYYGSDIALLAECALLGRFVATTAVFYNREHADRSVNIADKAARMSWHTGTLSNGTTTEHLGLLRHLVETTLNFRDVVPPHRSLPYVLAWALTPRQLARYTLDCTSRISPDLSSALKRFARQTAGKMSFCAARVREKADQRRGS